jgi:hypothetical protein
MTTNDELERQLLELVDAAMRHGTSDTSLRARFGEISKRLTERLYRSDVSIEHDDEVGEIIVDLARSGPPGGYDERCDFIEAAWEWPEQFLPSRAARGGSRAQRSEDHEN